MDKNLLNAITVYAGRYCLGRRTYAIDDYKKWILENIDNLNDQTKQVIIKDIENTKNLGDNCDRNDWQTILDALEIK